MKRKIALLVAIVMVLTMMPLTVSAAGYSDLQNHWAEEYINKWSLGDKPVLVGYGDTFGPEDPIKSVDLDLIIARILGQEGLVWKDSPVLNREQAYQKIAVAFGIAPKTVITAAERFADHDQISPDCAGYIYALKALGLANGMGNNTFSPKTEYTRAQAITVVYNMIDAIVDKDADVTQRSYAKSVAVRESGVTITGVTFEKDLIIGQGVGDGDVFLEDVVVNGKLVVLGGGMNSVHILGNSRINSLSGAKRTGQSANIRIAETANVSAVVINHEE